MIKSKNYIVGFFLIFLFNMCDRENPVPFGSLEYSIDNIRIDSITIWDEDPFIVYKYNYNESKLSEIISFDSYGHPAEIISFIYQNEILDSIFVSIYRDNSTTLKSFFTTTYKNGLIVSLEGLEDMGQESNYYKEVYSYEDEVLERIDFNMEFYLLQDTVQQSFTRVYERDSEGGLIRIKHYGDQPYIFDQPLTNYEISIEVDDKINPFYGLPYRIIIMVSNALPIRNNIVKLNDEIRHYEYNSSLYPVRFDSRINFFYK